MSVDRRNAKPNLYLIIKEKEFLPRFWRFHLSSTIQELPPVSKIINLGKFWLDFRLLKDSDLVNSKLNCSGSGMLR
jgi:hypothetical protein